MNNMKLVITGSNGFIGKNLRVHLRENGYDDIICIDRDNSVEQLDNALQTADFVFHLAGINRRTHDSEFYDGNAKQTEYIVKKLE